MPTSPVYLNQPPPPNRLSKQNRQPLPNYAQTYFDRSMQQQQKTQKSAQTVGFTATYRGVLGDSINPFRAGFNESSIEPPGSIPTHIRGRLSGWGEPYNISTHLDTQRIQNALRAAERGEMTLLFQIYRDYMLGNSHLQSEFAKRLMAVIGQPCEIKPWKKRGQKTAEPGNQKACEVIQDMVDNCDNWLKGLINLMQATVYPASAVEKIVEPNTDASKPWLRYRLKELVPVSPFLMSYKLPYMAAGGFQLPMNVPNVIAPNAMPLMLNEPGDTIWNPDTWEPDLRFFRTFPNGFIDYSWANMYAPDPMRHLIHRGDILSGAIRDNFGGVMRATLFWSFFALNARTQFAQAMGKYGQPFIVAEANMADVNQQAFLSQAFQNAQQIGGLLINNDSKVQLLQTMSTNLAQGWEIFIKLCNSEISKLIIGHEMTTTTKPGGLNEGETKQAGDVREDIRIFDQAMLRITLTRLSRWYLDINGFQDLHAPVFTWGGLSEDDASKVLAQAQMGRQAGLQLSDDGIDRLNELTGSGYERAPMPADGDPIGNAGTAPKQSKNKNAK